MAPPSSQTQSTSYAQGHPLGPPLDEWTFSPKTEARLHDYEKKYPKPTVAIPADEEELFCICVGFDDGSEMIECSNGTTCLYQWFHTRCLGLEHLPADHGELPSSPFRSLLQYDLLGTRRLVLSTLHSS